jgi:hypothetical protein
MFNLNAYSESKARVEKMIKAKLPRWETDQGFVLDGLFDPAEYAKQKIKILCILGEYYDHEKDKMIDISAQIKEGNSFYDFLGLRNEKFPNTRTAKTVPALLWYLYSHYDVEVEKDRDRFVPQNAKLFKTVSDEKIFYEAQKCYRRCGMIDIKKESASMADNQMQGARILQAAKSNREILIEQIHSIEPDLIIACGDVIVKGLIQEKITGVDKIPPKNIPVPLEKGRYFVYAEHPRMWWNHEKLYSLYKTIVQHIKLAV